MLLLTTHSGLVNKVLYCVSYLVFVVFIPIFYSVTHQYLYFTNSTKPNAWFSTHYARFVSCSSVNLNTVSQLLHHTYWTVRHPSLYSAPFIKRLKFLLENIYKVKSWFNTQQNRHRSGWCNKKIREFLFWGRSVPISVGHRLYWLKIFVVSVSTSKLI